VSSSLIDGTPLARRRRNAPRTGARRTVLQTIRQLPHYVALLGRLMTDRRVSTLDKALVGVALAYLLMPLDFIPDLVPFLGQVDDVFLLGTALQRLVSRAGRGVVRDHWAGDPAEVTDLNMERVVAAAAFFLPGRMRRGLTGLLRRS
jgi:uncharacterized membrane protein YkvA (DUF1232 family)